MGRMLTMLILATMCIAGLLATWLILRTRDADRPKIPHWLAVVFAVGVACVGGVLFLLGLILLVDRSAPRDAEGLWVLLILIGITLFVVAAGGPKNKTWRQIARIAGCLVLGSAILIVCMFGLLLHALRGPQPPTLQKLQSKFSQRRSLLEVLAGESTSTLLSPSNSTEAIERQKQLAAAEQPLEVLRQNEATLFVYGHENGPLVGGGRGPSWGYLYCPDPSDGNPPFICQDAAANSGVDRGPGLLYPLRLDQHWFAYSRGPSSQSDISLSIIAH